jgi:hypothetical protein
MVGHGFGTSLRIGLATRRGLGFRADGFRRPKDADANPQSAKKPDQQRRNKRGCSENKVYCPRISPNFPNFPNFGAIMIEVNVPGIPWNSTSLEFWGVLKMEQRVAIEMSVTELPRSNSKCCFLEKSIVIEHFGSID